MIQKPHLGQRNQENSGGLIIKLKYKGSSGNLSQNGWLLLWGGLNIKEVTVYGLTKLMCIITLTMKCYYNIFVVVIWETVNYYYMYVMLLHF